MNLPMMMVVVVFICSLAVKTSVCSFEFVYDDGGGGLYIQISR
jgi:hypothetical protein